MQNLFLIIDDDKNFATSVQSDLSALGSSLLANSVTDAMALIAKQTPTLVLLDFNLPETSGLEFLKTLKRRMPQLPVIMLTGEQGPETIIDTMKAGAID